MSVQFGKCNFDGKPIDPGDLNQVRPLLTPNGPDGEGCICNDNFGILYRAFHTTRESRNEVQPYSCDSGAIITWDGRLDNRKELIGDLGSVLSADSTDLGIVAAAYERWGSNSLAKLIGDWALSIWNPKDRSLILAKDFIGTRHLYYLVDKDQVMWCTMLDPLVLLSGRTLTLCEEYVAGWFSSFPAVHLTPYAGIHSVPPSSFVLLRNGKRTVTKYWDFDPGKRIRYRTDDEYEERFRTEFADAIRRRLRSDRPILSELSGGVDSSSIVCVADSIIAEGKAECPRLDTLSYFNDSEPNWNERPYFTKVEEKRGRIGSHIDLGRQEFLKIEFETDRFASTPVSLSGPSALGKQLAVCMNSQGNRVVLAGTGGDEVTGGVPTPVPELEDLLASARFGQLARQLKIWALNQRRPWFHLFYAVLRGFFPSVIGGTSEYTRPAPWLRSSFVNRHRAALSGYESKIKLFGPPPTFQENLKTLNALRRQLACSALSSEPLHERRYPYLDRDLLKFMYAVPRGQLVRPGQRRSLMRRALAGIVPDELLNRKRKAFVTRSQVAAISTEWNILTEESHRMVSDQLGIVNAEVLSESVQVARNGEAAPLCALQRTLAVELWLRTLQSSGILAAEVSGEAKPPVAQNVPNSRVFLKEKTSAS
jgi:asparagine synthase (glutamine-hydrolysing)